MPTCTSLKYGSEATLTIETDRQIPFEFTLADGEGENDSPLLLDCRISVQKGVGRFVTGSHENMNFYGFPPSYFTRFSRRIVIEIVDGRGEIVKHLTSDGTHAIQLVARNDATALHGQRFRVVEQ